MGSFSMVFSAEVMTILRCTELLLPKNLIRRRIHICCDSREVLAAIVKTTTESSLGRGCVQVLRKLSEFNKVTFAWIHDSKEYRAMRRQTDWPRKGLSKSHLARLLL
jgi:hypothetical protein